MTAYTINLNPIVEMTNEQFYRLCRANPDIKFERDTQGKLNHCKTRTVEIYRPGQEVEVLESPSTLSGETVLPEFMLDLQSVW
jgi:Uma2 family endonuclease